MSGEAELQPDAATEAEAPQNHQEAVLLLPAEHRAVPAVTPAQPQVQAGQQEAVPKQGRQAGALEEGWAKGVQCNDTNPRGMVPEGSQKENKLK